jgi:hypothetical protein
MTFPKSNTVQGTVGYQSSIDYVSSQLEALNATHGRLAWEYQHFMVRTNELSEESEPALRTVSTTTGTATATIDVDYTVMRNSGFTPAGGGEYKVVLVDEDGCEGDDYSSVSTAVQRHPEVPVFALVRRGTCFFVVKEANARSAGASALGIMNNVPGVIRAGLGSGPDMQLHLPSLVLSQEYGRQLASMAFAESSMRAFLSLSGQYREVETTNIIADVVNEGDDDAVIVVGAHLDSVPHGAGINDNGCVQARPRIMHPGHWTDCARALDCGDTENCRTC